MQGADTYDLCLHLEEEREEKKEGSKRAKSAHSSFAGNSEQQSFVRCTVLACSRAALKASAERQILKVTNLDRRDEGATSAARPPAPPRTCRGRGADLIGRHGETEQWVGGSEMQLICLAMVENSLLSAMYECLKALTRH
ncbi:hypothetical protein EVAR_5870_1 [Eumeta japonica]|uniref:Uncharacterized protein n=1 Tax=Eumeta variegata TaxID=151549 RepID=A0A4C1TC36_EUMVA|nr:hypothetical protein EVAR_5870_1 [Eumeta japonica]